MPSLYYFLLWTFAFWFFWLQQTSTKLIPANWKIRKIGYIYLNFQAQKSTCLCVVLLVLLFWRKLALIYELSPTVHRNFSVVSRAFLTIKCQPCSHVSKGFRLNGNHQNISFYIRSFKFCLSFHGWGEIAKAQGIGIDRFAGCPLLWTWSDLVKLIYKLKLFNQILQFSAKTDCIHLILKILYWNHL